MAHEPLPIDALLPELRAALAAGPALVLQAPPGAGKTTRVPPLLLDEPWAAGGEVLVLEPRRIAAYLSAARVASERGGALGQEVGVQMRYDSVCGPATRLRYLTEGVLLRRLLTQPTLPGVRAVVLDEFHERHLQGDLALALLRALQRGPRPELRVVVMSATLESEALQAYLGCPVLRSEGRQHPVEVAHLPEPDERPLEKLVRSALHRLLVEESTAGAVAAGGDVLVFLPGAAEIRRAQTELQELAAQRGLALVPLHGDLALAEQQRAVGARAAGAARKIILTTNVAETSVTVPGVTVVIDGGLARVAGHSPWSGLPTLRLSRVCKAAAIQRAGRAGRTQPGRCLRLYTRHDFESRPDFETPEIQRLDLADAVLLLRSLGQDPAALTFLSPPKEAALRAAEVLLQRLGAVDERGAVTALGQRMARAPVHPRQARLLLSGAERGVGAAAATVAAILGERDLRGSGLSAGPRGPREAAHREVSDLLHRLDLFEEARRGRMQGLDAGAVHAVERARKHLLPLVAQGARRPARDDRERGLSAAEEDALLQAILDGYPDRVARRRVVDQRTAAAPGHGGSAAVDLILAGGGTVQLSPQSVAQEEELVVIVDAEERSAAAGERRGAQAVARLCSGIKADWLLDLPGGALRETSEALWQPAGQRVELVRRLQYEQLTLDESRVAATAGDPAVTAVLRAAALQAGPALWASSKAEGEGVAEAVAALQQRVAFVVQHCPEAGFALPEGDVVALAIADLCAGCTSFAELRAASLLQAVRARLGVGDGARLQQLARLAPESVTLPGGRRAALTYLAGQAPFVASRLQDFFGMASGPAVAGGKVPLVLHLLAPNQRPVQVTTDLAGFWARHYPALRRELGRKYPRHLWPEDPLTAAPPTPGRPR